MKRLYYPILFLAFVGNICTGGNKTSESIPNLKQKKYSSGKHKIESSVDVDVNEKNSKGYMSL